jgi:hypothetical protein
MSGFSPCMVWSFMALPVYRAIAILWKISSLWLLGRSRRAQRSLPTPIPYMHTRNTAPSTVLSRLADISTR